MSLSIRLYTARAARETVTWERGLESAKLHASFQLVTDKAERAEVLDEAGIILWASENRDHGE